VESQVTAGVDVVRCCCEGLVAEAGEGKACRWKPLPINGSEGVTVDTSMSVIVICKVQSRALPKSPTIKNALSCHNIYSFVVYARRTYKNFSTKTYNRNETRAACSIVTRYVTYVLVTCQRSTFRCYDKPEVTYFSSPLHRDDKQNAFNSKGRKHSTESPYINYEYGKTSLFRINRGERSSGLMKQKIVLERTNTT
jgi:hypothetical protein